MDSILVPRAKILESKAPVKGGEKKREKKRVKKRGL
jgi:hypothetical protein